MVVGVVRDRVASGRHGPPRRRSGLDRPPEWKERRVDMRAAQDPEDAQRVVTVPAIVEGEGHMVTDAGAYRRIAAFFDEHLGGSAAAAAPAP